MNLLAITGTGALIFMAVFIILVAFPFIFYLLTLQRTLREVSFENRKMQPEQVWLSLIPLFGIVWQYFIVARLSDSLSLELQKRNIYPEERRPAYNIGIAFCILISCIIIPYINVLALVGGLVCWVLYWLKVNDYLNTLRENPLNYLSN
ncbi:MAG: hypothetical protein K9J30_04535 [Bacteroidales bacterium]|nr:hypothetical protein [Bacteroidales bacterium]